MANAPVGRVLLISKGDYSASTTYKMLDWVRHDNKAWVCKQESIGNAPQDGVYWQLLAQDGAEGGYCYIRYSANADGTGFVATPTIATKYIGFYTGDSDVAPTDKADYTWSKFIGEDGKGISIIAKTNTSGLVDTYTITYTDDTTTTFNVTNGKDGNLNYYGTLITGNSTTPTAYATGITMARVNDSYTNTTTFFEYRCTVAGNATTAKWVYVGSKKGADGLGSGDMTKATYDTNNNGIVDNAEKLGGKLPSHYLYSLPIGGTNLGGVKNGGNVTIDAEGNMNADVGAGTWDEVEDKPFSTVGTDGLKITSNTLDVDLTKVQSILADATTSASGKMSAADKTKLNGIATGANNYILPTASTSVKGGVKIGNGLVIDSEIVRVDKYTFANVAVATADFATYTATLTGEADLATAGYDYKAHIASTGVTANHEANVVFGAIEADSGNYASIATTEAGYVNIYAKAVPSGTITIPTIDCTYKGV